MGNSIHFPWPDIPIPWPWPIEKQPLDSLSNATETDCETENDRKYLGDLILLSTAACLFVLLNLLKWLISCKRMPQIIVPVDFLDSTPFRLIYTVIMTLWAADVFQDLFSHDFHYHSENNSVLDAAKFFGQSPTVIFLREALLYFPVLACVDFTLPCLGHSLGFIYTLLLASYNIFCETVTLRGCSHRGQLAGKDIAVSLCVVVPVYLGYLLVAGWFFCSAAMELALLLFTKRSLTQNPGSDSLDPFQNHVKSLFQNSRRASYPHKRRLSSYAYHGFRYVLPYHSSFQYPLSFLAAISMSWMVIYQLTLQFITKQIEYAHRIRDFVVSFNITVEELSKIFPERQLFMENVFYDAKSLAEAFLIIPPFATAISFGVCAFFTLYLVQNFHKLLVRAAEGDISFLLASEPLPSKAYVLAAAMKFSAFQMAYLVFTWVIYYILLLALQAIGLIFYYLFKDWSSLAVILWSWFMVPMMWASALHLLQLSLCRYIFLAREEGNLIHIRFRSVYQLVTYILYFFNVMIGMMLSFLRLFSVVIFTAVMYMRLDRDVFMRGLEGWDFGHRTFVGYMYLQYTRNNAVLRVFVHLLANKIRSRTAEGGVHNFGIQDNSSVSSYESETTSLLAKKKLKPNAGMHGADTQKVSSRRARNLWLVAYTLIHNPQLQSLTAKQIKASATVTGDY